MVVLTKEKNIKNFIRRTIAESVQEIFSDPDFGLELSAKAKTRLRNALKSKQKIVSFSKIKEKYL